MMNSRAIAGLVGPTLMAMIAAEYPLVQPGLYDAQIPPVVYLSGVLMFVGGLAIVRAHNLWVWDWRVLVTLTGWCGLTLGLVRMFSAQRYLQGSAGTSPILFLVLEGGLFIAGLAMTVQAYRQPASYRNGLIEEQ